ncbi:CCAAT/enhancer-binding protein zeta isoform X2 [Hydra vulgaris]|uniref:CCAAT/enhancer-binding protein zeta isoform X2 n=1 Tax=Hydra vulgaris TaxID=6087 RepID=A0ABM4CGV3_HYDVU
MVDVKKNSKAKKYKQNANKKPNKVVQEEDKTTSLNKKDFNVDVIQTLGGDKDDYDYLVNIDEDEDVVPQDDEPVDINDITKELQTFIKDIGLDKGCQKKKKSSKIESASISECTNTDSLTKSKTNEIIVIFPYEKQSKLLLKNCVPWYQQLSDLPKGSSNLSKSDIEKFYQVAKLYWEDESNFYQESKNNDHSSDQQWLRTVLKSGTLSDKVAALVMVTQESPVHCLRSLDALMNMAKKKSRREALIAIDSLRHLWIADLLPESKLKYFHEYEIESLKAKLCKDGSKESQIKLLILLAYQHQIKDIYKQFVEIIETLSKDFLTDIRNKVLGIIYELLVMKAEQEQKLLTMLINKLGDPERKISSKTIYLLTQLVVKHPNMKEVVINEIEQFLYRPNMAEKAQYYAICFLNQIVLSQKEKNIAAKLIQIYFSFFKLLVKKENSKAKDVQETKLLSALLTGVNRAFPYCNDKDEDFDEQLNNLFRLTHINHLSTSIQAFMLIYQVQSSRQCVSDRYYQALYEKLLDPDIKTTSKHTMLLNLLFKSIKNDPVPKRVKAFVKRLLQVCTKEESSLTCGILFLLSEVIKENPAIKSMISQPEEEDEEEHFRDAEDNDKNVVTDDSGDDVNKSLNSQENENSFVNKPKDVSSSWTFINQEKRSKTYNLMQRNPLFANAEMCCAWELLPLFSHFHPSVSHFASSILSEKGIVYKGDPLQDFTLIRFLDRFMYRNPKKKEVEHGSSVMQPRDSSVRLKEEPVNSKTFIQSSEDKIRKDEIFFYRYFTQKEIKKKRDIKDDEDQHDTEDLVNFKDIDFASEIKKGKEISKSKKKDKGKESSDESDGDGDFDYNDLEDESDEDFEDNNKKENFTDKDYEDALFKNLNSDGESIDGEASEDGDIEKMFASAEEFSHMLDDHAETIHPKQKKWEERAANKQWRPKRINANRKRNFDNKSLNKKTLKKQKK